MRQEPLHSYRDPHQEQEEPTSSAPGVKRVRIAALAYAIIALLIVIAVLVIAS